MSAGALAATTLLIFFIGNNDVALALSTDALKECSLIHRQPLTKKNYDKHLHSLKINPKKMKSKII